MSQPTRGAIIALLKEYEGREYPDDPIDYEGQADAILRLLADSQGGEESSRPTVSPTITRAESNAGQSRDAAGLAGGERGAS